MCWNNPTGFSLLKVNSGHCRAMREICSKLTKILERRHDSLTLERRRVFTHCSGVFIVDFEMGSDDFWDGWFHCCLEMGSDPTRLVQHFYKFYTSDQLQNAV